MDTKNPDAAKLLRENIGATDDPEVIDEIKEIIAASGALEEIERRISSLRDSGLEYLHAAEIDPQVTQTLEMLAFKSTTRSK